MSHILVCHNMICKDVQTIINDYLMPSKKDMKEKFDSVVYELNSPIPVCTRCDFPADFYICRECRQFTPRSSGCYTNSLYITKRLQYNKFGRHYFGDFD